MFVYIIKAADLGWLATCRQRSTKLSTTFANVWTCAFRPI